VAVVNCPNCSTALKVPDGSAAAVRCPRCKTVFRPPAPPPAFEVVEDEPAPPPPPPPPKPKPTAKPPAKPAPAPKVEEEEPARQPKKAIPIRKAAAEEDEEDRPPPRRREDDEEDDRPRRKKKKRRPVYEEDGDGKPSVGPARTGLTLLSVSLWMYGGAVGLLAFYLFLGWVGLGFGYGMFLIPGFVGAANWVVALVGIGFCLAHRKAQGLAIAALCVAVVHLGLTVYDATDTKPKVKADEESGFRITGGTGGRMYGLFAGFAMAGYGSKFQAIGERLQKNPGDQAARKESEELFKELQEASKSWQNPTAFWEEFGTMMPAVDSVITDLVYNSKYFKYQVVGLLAGLSELARLVLVLLLVGAVARAGRAHAAAQRCTDTVVLVGIAAAGCVVIPFLYALIIHEAKPEGKIWGHLWIILLILTYLVHAGMALLTALVTRDARDDVG
jgi:LSD1 subclass zinc finger protein